MCTKFSNTLPWIILYKAPNDNIMGGYTRRTPKIQSATSHSEVQYTESLWTTHHYVMRLTIYLILLLHFCMLPFLHVASTHIILDTNFQNLFESCSLPTCPNSLHQNTNKLPVSPYTRFNLMRVLIKQTPSSNSCPHEYLPMYKFARISKMFFFLCLYCRVIYTTRLMADSVWASIIELLVLQSRLDRVA